ncbi:hypothetical protein IKE13_03645 [Candidatus Saccharibacteria bacterium]|nr:hypothetical protein [Candidatus Saccharibacteria bacterium]
MADIMQSGFLTRSEGNDGELAFVRFNSGTSKRMRHARKRCLDDVHNWSKSLHRLPTKEDWPQNPQMFTMETVKELFGSFEAMLAELEKRKQPKTHQKSEVKVTQMTDAEGKELSRKQLFTDQRLAEILYEASAGKNRITPSEYARWYKSKGATPMDYPKNLQTIFNRLGRGRASVAFKRMRELLGLPEEEPQQPRREKTGQETKKWVDKPDLESKSEPEPKPKLESEPESEPSPDPESRSEIGLAFNSEPEPEAKSAPEPESAKVATKEVLLEPETQPEINLAAPCYKLVNTLGYSFSIGPLRVEASNGEGRAVIEKTQLITGKSDLVTSRQLKLALEIPGQLVDFPAPQEGIFYLIDAKLCHEMGPLSLSDRHDFIPVYHQDNFPPDTQYRNLYGLHVFIDD